MHRKKGKQRAFLNAFAECGNVSQAAKAAKIPRMSHYQWIHDDEYKAAFDDAKQEANDSLEAEARRRAVEGVDEPVGWYQGEAGGVIRRYSDILLMFLLKGAMPEKYRDRPEAGNKPSGDDPLPWQD